MDQGKLILTDPGLRAVGIGAMRAGQRERRGDPVAQARQGKRLLAGSRELQRFSFVQRPEEVAARRGLSIEEVAPAGMLRARREAEALAASAAREGTA